VSDDYLYAVKQIDPVDDESDDEVDDVSSVQPTAMDAAAAYRASLKDSASGMGSFRSVKCPMCYETIGGQRFAPHLEKCMKGGKRGGRKDKYYSSLSLPYYNINAAKPKPPMTLVDPHPQSLVVRIRLKNGQPKYNNMRCGATIEEFEGRTPTVQSHLQQGP